MYIGHPKDNRARPSRPNQLRRCILRQRVRLGDASLWMSRSAESIAVFTGEADETAFGRVA
jgi:hypothetical protein